VPVVVRVMAGRAGYSAPPSGDAAAGTAPVVIPIIYLTPYNEKWHCPRAWTPAWTI
jgi:hypothetical protein